MLNSIKGSVSNLLSRINLCGGSNNVVGAQVPQKYKVGSRVIQEERLISEGGYGYVWECHDVGTKQKFAVKKMLLQVIDQLSHNNSKPVWHKEPGGFGLGAEGDRRSEETA